MTSHEMAIEFHRTLGLPIGDRVADVSRGTLARRLTLIGEEVGELVAAMCGFDRVGSCIVRDYLIGLFVGYAEQADEPDLAEVAKEIVDVHYVVSGTAVEYGIPEDAVYDVVHASNLAKVWPDGTVHQRADGKVLKPAGWKPPDVAGVLAARRHEWLREHVGEPAAGRSDGYRD